MVLMIMEELRSTIASFHNSYLYDYVHELHLQLKKQYSVLECPPARRLQAETNMT